MNNLLPLPVLLPLLGAGLALALSRHPRAQRVVSTTVMLAVVARRRRAGLPDRPVRADRALGRRLAAAARHRAGRRPAVGADAAGLLGGHPDGADLRHGPGRGGAQARDAGLDLPPDASWCSSAGVSNAFLAGDLFNLFVGFEILLFASYVLLTLGGTGERIRAGTTYVVVSLLSSLLFLIAIAAIYAATGTVNLAQLSLRLAELPDRRPAGPAAAAADRVLDQGGGLPAVGLAARLLPDRARPGHRGVRRPADQGRRVRDHPHPDGAVPRQPADRPADVGRAGRP